VFRGIGKYKIENGKGSWGVENSTASEKLISIWAEKETENRKMGKRE
jgi:hypothetical protein